MAPKIRAEAKSRNFILTRVSPQERELVLEAARVNRQSISAFMRDAAMSAVGDCIETPPRTARTSRLAKLSLS